MRRKILGALTTPRNQKILRDVPTAVNFDFPTGFAQAADTTEAKLLRRVHHKIIIGVDLMGSDNAPPDLIEALKPLIPSNVELLLIGTPEFEKYATPFRFQAAPDVIGMEEAPLLALRRKRGASLSVGMRLLKEKKIDALVSAGNTGALVSSAKITLSTLPGILRPALLALMPTKKNPVAILDVGANLQVKTKHLIQFALIGAAYQQARGLKNPSIGILNIGSEALKGTSELRSAYQQLKKMPFLQFVGNIEGKSVFDGDVDVLITDGFTGNIFLKTAEGIASLILDRIRTHIPPAELKKFEPQIEDLQRHLHYAEYPGALLAGVQGIVIKCHGYSTPRGFANGVLGAIELVSQKFIQTLQDKLNLLLTNS